MLARALMFTHNDLDGIGCAMVGRVLGISNINYCSYTKESKYNFETQFKDVCGNDESLKYVVVGDIGITDEMWENIKDSIREDVHVSLFDHHESSESAKSYKDRVDCNIDTSRCATQVMYNYYREDNPELDRYSFEFEAINCFDMWDGIDKNQTARNLQRIYDWVMFQDPRGKYKKFKDKLTTFTNCMLEDPIMDKDSYPYWMKSCIKMYLDNTMEKIIAAKNRIQIDNGVALIPVKSSENVPLFELSWIMDKKHPDVKDLVYVIEDDSKFKKSSVTYSIRSRRDNIDLSKVAEQFGGGGHKQAASFQVPLEESANATKKVVEFLNMMQMKG